MPAHWGEQSGIWLLVHCEVQVETFTHVPPVQTAFDKHLLPQLPQLFLSLVISAQEPEQQV